MGVRGTTNTKIKPALAFSGGRGANYIVISPSPARRVGEGYNLI
jgi:hypothetical protein